MRQGDDEVSGPRVVEIEERDALEAHDLSRIGHGDLKLHDAGVDVKVDQVSALAEVHLLRMGRTREAGNGCNSHYSPH